MTNSKKVEKPTEKQIKDLASISIGIKAKDMEDVRAKMIEFLKKHDIEGDEDYVLKNVIPKGEFQFNYLANGGVTVKYKSDNITTGFFSFDSPKVTADREIVGNIYLSSVKDEETLIALFGEDIETKIAWSGIREVVDISLSDICSSIEKNKAEFDKVLAKLAQKNERLAKIRKKMEEDLRATTKIRLVEAIKRPLTIFTKK